MKVAIFLVFLFAYSLCVDEGIDVSAWQGNINWANVKRAGKKFAILRAGTGKGNKDKYFEQNYQNAKAQGIPVGVYWYSYANSGAEAKNEAALCHNILKGKKFEYPIYIDIEEKSIFQKNIANDLAINFCSYMESNKYFCGIYSSLYYYNSYFNKEVKAKYSLWVAQWGPDHCTYDGPFGVWQYSSTGSVSGISGNVDLDKSYSDFPTIIKNAHLNGY